MKSLALVLAVLACSFALQGCQGGCGLGTPPDIVARFPIGFAPGSSAIGTSYGQQVTMMAPLAAQAPTGACLPYGIPAPAAPAPVGVPCP